MKFKILKEKDFGKGKYWLLAELNLLQYVESLVDDNFNFEVQRKIVKNRYLDGLLNTIELGEPLPNITLAYHEPLSQIKESSTVNLIDSKLDILDGLQRTYRLWAFWKIYIKIKENNYNNLKDAILGIKSSYPQFFENGIVDSKFFKYNFPEGKTNIDFHKKYSTYTLYFTIWSNLSEPDLVKKMLVLNAGHKAVSTQHQFEILFLNLWKSLNNELVNIRVIREKEIDFNLIKRGERKPGEYLFSSIITSLMSLVLAKPQRISSDIIYRYDLINENDEGNSLQYTELIFNSEFIKKLLKKLFAIDSEMSSAYGKEGLAWFGKDTTLNGVFAGVGVYLNLNSSDQIDGLDEKILESFEELKTSLTKELNLNKFNAEYDSLSGRSVNIGNLIRSVVMNYTIHKLKKESTNWMSLFNQEMKKK
ncbi:hypothetical protein [Algoriphagus chordae]|uniref:DUF262 domain-containing protein n=1 Tax=Algoriphagus chordae TaxID=237019 RepID=A0A2W7QWK7_9BACT|nr:hypothetical protein [Algoriphagus chordae]PZX46019.1 hypothetical protein LV85_04386 [Algoriphagus chordae]